MADKALLKMLEALRLEIRMLRLVAFAERHTTMQPPYAPPAANEDLQIDRLAREALEGEEVE